MHYPVPKPTQEGIGMKRILTKNRHLIVQGISYLYVLLFVYTAISKLLDFENFGIELAQSPLLSAYAGLIAPSVIIVELLIVVLLCFKATRLIGLYASFFLMIAFTVYIYLILNYSDFIPCSCGGIIEELSWTEHLVFNLIFAALALIAIVLTEKEKGTPTVAVVLKSVLPSLMAVGVVVALFLSSEHIIKKENNFIRRFGQHPIRDEIAFDLGVNSYYFAGIADGQVYLGNITAPFILTTVDTALTTKTEKRIQPDDTEHPFRSIQIKVKSPHFYMYDGSVPVIYRGRLDDSLARTISYADCYFSQLEVIDSVHFVFRTQSTETRTQILGKLALEQDPKVILNHELLEKQIDGVFDTDGQLLRDDITGELVYIYFYRNQFMVVDSSLHLSRRLHTIDTISRAQVQVRSLSDGRHKMEAPPLQVNKRSVVHNRLLFNESNLMGKYESREMWNQTAIIDMYRIDRQEYLGSFYVPNRGGHKMARMIVTDEHLFVLSGNEIVRYRFAQSVTRHFIKTGDAENLN